MTRTDETDQALARLAASGDGAAFERLVARHRPAIEQQCRRYLPESRAEDAVQDTLLAAWRALQAGEDVREPSPWLRRIAHHRAIDAARKNGWDCDELPRDLRASGSTESEVERRIFFSRTISAVAGLPTRQRTALVGMAVDGRTERELAAELELPCGAVRQLVRRARVTLRQAVAVVAPPGLTGRLSAWLGRGEAGELVGGAGAGAGLGVAAILKAGAVVLAASALVTVPNATRWAAEQARHATATAAAEPNSTLDGESETGAISMLGLGSLKAPRRAFGPFPARSGRERASAPRRIRPELAATPQATDSAGAAPDDAIAVEDQDAETAEGWEGEEVATEDWGSDDSGSEAWDDGEGGEEYAGDTDPGDHEQVWEPGPEEPAGEEPWVEEPAVEEPLIEIPEEPAADAPLEDVQPDPAERFSS